MGTVTETQIWKELQKMNGLIAALIAEVRKTNALLEAAAARQR